MSGARCHFTALRDASGCQTKWGNRWSLPGSGVLFLLLHSFLLSQYSSSLSSRHPAHLSPHAASLGCYLSELLSQSFSFSLVGGDGLFKLDLEGSQLFGHGGNGSLEMERPLGLWEAGLRPDCQASRQACGVNALRSSPCQ